jgi:hypothetical protein
LVVIKGYEKSILQRDKFQNTLPVKPEGFGGTNRQVDDSRTIVTMISNKTVYFSIPVPDRMAMVLMVPGQLPCGLPVPEVKLVILFVGSDIN